MSDVRFIKGEVGNVIYGYDPIIDRVMECILARFHILVESVPGLSKSLLCKTVARTIDGAVFRRLQMTPDMRPSDILGFPYYDQTTNTMQFANGPLKDTHILLCDEINRCPSKPQSALLEAMAEGQISLRQGAIIQKMEPFFLLMATQNGIEVAGTVPLGEAQLDRFGVQLNMGYVPREAELKVIRTPRLRLPNPELLANPATNVTDILAAQKDVRDNVQVGPDVEEYIRDLVAATRPSDPLFQLYIPEYQGKVKLGGSPRAMICLTDLAKARAWLRGSRKVDFDDIKDLAPDVLRHRILLTDEAKLDNLTSDDVIQVLLDRVHISNVSAPLVVQAQTPVAPPTGAWNRFKHWWSGK